MVGPQGNGMMSPQQLDAAFDYIKADPAIWEVILTGGDPLVLSPRRLFDLMQRPVSYTHLTLPTTPYV